MKRKFSSFFLMLLAASPLAMADQVAVDEAMAIANSFSNDASVMRKAPSKVKMELAYKASQAGEVHYYVFNRGNADGYVIVAGDDCVDSILGYADSGSFDYSNMPEAMRWWLSQYEAEIAHAIATPALTHYRAPLRAQEVEPSVGPLLKSKWNQNSPYNDQCPSGTMVGCVATAVGQIMYYYQYPAVGEGTHTNSVNASAITVDFSKSEYNWGAMTDTYDSSSSAESKAAVAKLLADVGCAVNMKYGASSGASSTEVPLALAEHFGYGSSAQYLYRDYYSFDEWRRIIVNELKSGNPVYYSGQNGNGGGHAFVCDGYKSGDFFHINWGWSGMSDGYFKLSALDPAQQGIGGSTSGYNYQQAIVCGIRPDKSSVGDADALSFACTDNFTVAPTTVSKNGKVTVATDNDTNGCFYSLCKYEVKDFYYGLKIESIADGSVSYVKSAKFPSIVPWAGATYYQVLMGEYAAGSYKVTPAVCNSKGDWFDVGLLPNKTQYLNMTVDAEGNMTFGTPAAEYALNLESLDIVLPLRSTTLFEISAKVSNSGKEYYGDLSLVLYNVGTSKEVAKVRADINKGETAEVTFSGRITGLQPGDYKAKVLDFAGNEIAGSGITVTVGASSNNSTLVFNSITPVSSVHDNAKFVINVTGKNGYYCRALTLVIFNSAGSQSLAQYPFTVSVENGETKEYDITFKQSLGEPGTQVRYAVFESTSCINNPNKTLTLTESTSAAALVVNSVESSMEAGGAVNLAAQLSSVEGYDGNVCITVTDAEGNEVGSHLVGLIMEENDSYVLNYMLEGLKDGATYTVTVTDGSKSSNDVKDKNGNIFTTTFTVDLSGLEAITIADNAEVEVFALSGVKVAAGVKSQVVSSLAPGIYVVKSAGAVQKLIVR